MTEPPRGDVVSLVDIFAKQIEISVQLAAITEQLKQLPDHENRIRYLERRSWQVPASATASGGALAAALLAVIRALHG